MSSAKTFEIVLADGRFASLRPMKWLDVLIAGMAMPFPAATLLSRIGTLDGETFTPEQWTEFDYDDIAPIVNEMNARFDASRRNKGIA